MKSSRCPHVRSPCSLRFSFRSPCTSPQVLAKIWFEKSAIFVKIQQHFCKCRKICKILNFAKIQKCQLDNLVDFEKCCKTRICLQRSAPIQPKTSEILPKFCQKLATTLRVHGAPSSVTAEPGAVRPAWPCGPPPPLRLASQFKFRDIPISSLPVLDCMDADGYNSRLIGKCSPISTT